MRNKFRQVTTKAVAVAAAIFMGISPMTVFAQGGPECTCETKCGDKDVNEECELCREDYIYCEGVEAEPEEEQAIEETYGPLTPDGNLTLVDDYGTIEAGGKQFITVVTKSGNYFYIIIDRDDEGDETVHFLNMVDESDLLALMEDEDAQAYLDSVAANQEAVVEPEEQDSSEESTEAEEENTEKEEKKSSNTGLLVLLLIATAGGIGGYLYLKAGKAKAAKKDAPDPDADYFEDEEDYLAGLEEDDFSEEEFDEPDEVADMENAEAPDEDEEE